MALLCRALLLLSLARPPSAGVRVGVRMCAAAGGERLSGRRAVPGAVGSSAPSTRRLLPLPELPFPPATAIRAT